MFCNQCEQTAKGQGCTLQGVCGKTALVAEQQDRLIYALRGLALAALAARDKGIIDMEADIFTAKVLFATLTNVNFDPARFDALLAETLDRRNMLALQGSLIPNIAEPDTQPDELINPLTFSGNADIRSAMQILLFGLKGVAAYADHASILGETDPDLYTFIHTALAAGFDGKIRTIDDWVTLILQCGKANLRAMQLLEAGNTKHYGNPVPTKVALGHKEGTCILVSGHDLCDLDALLRQTEGRDIAVYTHGEMLPAHGYPKLKKYAHFYGHYGTAWQNQHKEFPAFPGPVLFTTNCIQNPQGYADKIFTTGMVGWPGCTHCLQQDFSSLIQKALEMNGFPDALDAGQVSVGFGQQTLLGAAPLLLEALKEGTLRHIFLVGGCDGAKPGRNYYTEFVEKTPADTLILTLACGKFRFFDKKLGTLKNSGIPRLMDVGQCNDAYAAIQAALALAAANHCSVNDLPLSFILSWYEQKAVAILLTLFFLEIKNIRLGPSLPAFISPHILDFLMQHFNIKPIRTPDEDLKDILG